MLRKRRYLGSRGFSLPRQTPIVRYGTDAPSSEPYLPIRHAQAIPDGINAIGTHRITWPQMVPFIRREVVAMLDKANTAALNEPLVLQAESAAYRTSAESGCGARLAA
jgi:hypothetical protein